MVLMWAGMSSGPFDLVDPSGVGGSQPRERRGEVGAHIGIGILLDDQRRRGVPKKEKQRSLLRRDLVHELRNLAR